MFMYSCCYFYILIVLFIYSYCYVYVLCFIMSFYVLFVCKCVLYCTVLLPPDVNPTAVNTMYNHIPYPFNTCIFHYFVLNQQNYSWYHYSWYHYSWYHYSWYHYSLYHYSWYHYSLYHYSWYHYSLYHKVSLYIFHTSTCFDLPMSSSGGSTSAPLLSHTNS
jgi:hypothetical protein